jgi:formimidoylglutamate deiminase
VDVDELPAITEKVRAALGEHIPIHMHIAEQQAEVDDCREKYGKTPVATLADRIDLDDHWNLVHATHTSDAELDAISASGATVVLCPLTEAYLGDGIFPATQFLARGGRIAIGSDSNARICATEELRMLEYGQRLVSQRRARLSDEKGLGQRLWRHTARAGATALGRASGVIEAGRRADIAVLDQSKAPLLGPAPEHVLDALVIGGSRDCIKDVYVAGKKQLSDGIVSNAPDAQLFARTITGMLDD